MRKWKFTALLGLVFGAAGMGWGYAQQQKAEGFYELRVYTAQPGKRDALAERFATRTAAIYARHGITNVGYWIPSKATPNLASGPRTRSFTCARIPRRKSATSA
jgi:NIPSNAP